MVRLLRWEQSFCKMSGDRRTVHKTSPQQVYLVVYQSPITPEQAQSGCSSNAEANERFALTHILHKPFLCVYFAFSINKLQFSIGLQACAPAGAQMCTSWCTSPRTCEISEKVSKTRTLAGNYLFTCLSYVA